MSALPPSGIASYLLVYSIVALQLLQLTLPPAFLGYFGGELKVPVEACEEQPNEALISAVGVHN